MTYILDTKQLQAALLLPADKRYEYFITHIISGKQIWSLRNDEGWVAMSCDGDSCLPVWPHQDFAALWATDDWADCSPTAVALDVWVSRWIPGMEKDGSMIAVFPNDNEEGVVVTPRELLESIKLEQSSEQD